MPQKGGESFDIDMGAPKVRTRPPPRLFYILDKNLKTLFKLFF